MSSFLYYPEYLLKNNNKNACTLPKILFVTLWYEYAMGNKNPVAHVCNLKL